MIKKSALSIMIFIALFIFGPGISHAIEFQHLVVFGDSLSDNGIDDGHGFLRYSNGKVWPEYLAERMGVKTLEVRAWSGAMSGMGNYNSNAKDWSGLSWQVQEFTPATTMENTLIIVQIGTNDLHDPDMKITPAQVVDNVVKVLKQLSSKGAKNIILWNLNTTLVSPGYTDKKYEWFDYYKSKKEAAIKQFKKFNQLIQDAVNGFNAKQKTIRVVLFDADSALTEIAKKFENITTPWKGTKYYPKKGGWFWFDHWHYMTVTHRYIADYLFKSL
jgi:lysophospholipase L1-like esterase